MNLQNSPVKFRRGSNTVLPQEITDGYISLNVDEGQMYADLVMEDGSKRRIALNGYLFGISQTEPDTLTKVVYIPGVPTYFDGMIVTVIFTGIDKSSSDNLSLSIVSDLSALPAVSLMCDTDTELSGIDIEENTPYTFVYRDGMFLLNQGTVSSRPKWKHLADRN